MKIEELIIKLTKVHNGRYDYRSIDRCDIDIKSRIDVICADHGLFDVVAHDHLYHRTNCPKCAVSNRRVDFVSKATEKFGDTFDYSLVKYSRSDREVDIICHKHGIFKQVAAVHLSSKYGCPKCKVDMRTSSKAVFVEKANTTHDSVYDYTSVNYVNCKVQVEITCRRHGVFCQTPDNHLRGAGCPKCAGDTLRGKYVAGLNRAPNKPGTLYVARFSNQQESFFKVGITTMKKPSYRYGTNHKGYHIDYLFEIQLDIHRANCIEKQILENLQQYKHRPNHWFGGHTECLDINISLLYDEINRLLELI